MRTLRLLLVSLVAVPVLAAAPPNTGFVYSVLHDRMRFSAAEIAAVAAGHGVAKFMRMDSGQDVLIFGAVRIAAPPEAFINQVRDIESYERRLGVINVGKVHEPPRLEDFSALTLDNDDLDALKTCRPGDCDVQAPAEMMERFRHEVHWQAPDAAAQANQCFRQMLLDLLARYQKGGIPALGTYDDRGTPVSIASEFALLKMSRDLPADLPDLLHYVSVYPTASLPGAEDFYYWNTGEFGMKPTTRLNHVTIYPVANAGERPDGIRFAVTTVQIYSDHYFSATFELRTIVDDDADPGGAFYLFYTSKSRVGGLTGIRGTLIRPIVKSRARSGMERYLTNTRVAVEAAYHAPAAPAAESGR